MPNLIIPIKRVERAQNQQPILVKYSCLCPHIISFATDLRLSSFEPRMEYLHRKGVYWTIEQPASSVLALLPNLEATRLLDFCRAFQGVFTWLKVLLAR